MSSRVRVTCGWLHCMAGGTTGVGPIFRVRIENGDDSALAVDGQDGGVAIEDERDQEDLGGINGVIECSVSLLPVVGIRATSAALLRWGRWVCGPFPIADGRPGRSVGHSNRNGMH